MRSLKYRRFVFGLLSALLLLANVSNTVFADNYGNASDQTKRDLGIYFIDNNGVGGVCSGDPSVTASSGNNLDYAGHPILTQGQLAAISTNSSVYKTAAQQVDIPWQMLAVVHLREHGLQVDNPPNGQGMYQFYDQHGGPYPAGPVDQAEFLRQSVLAAQFLKGKASSNVTGHTELTSTSNADTIKDTFFSYNGRASVYAAQAGTLGFNPLTQPYEGSPYVMNKADAKRDPDVNKTTWGQIKRDNGPIEYPANSDYGAFVEYSALAGLPTTGCGGADCSAAPNGPTTSLSTVRQKVVCLTEGELQLWDSGNLAPGAGHDKYSQGRSEDWCADFASWIYAQAGAPLTKDNQGNVPGVSAIQQIGKDTGRYHDKTGYTPVPGDLVIRLNGESHVNIVVSVTGTSMVVIGGNQGNNDHELSRVSKYTDSYLTDSGISGYVSPE